MSLEAIQKIAIQLREVFSFIQFYFWLSLLMSSNQ